MADRDNVYYFTTRRLYGLHMRAVPSTSRGPAVNLASAGGVSGSRGGLSAYAQTLVAEVCCPPAAA